MKLELLNNLFKRGSGNPTSQIVKVKPSAYLPQAQEILSNYQSQVNSGRIGLLNQPKELEKMTKKDWNFNFNTNSQFFPVHNYSAPKANTLAKGKQNDSVGIKDYQVKKTNQNTARMITAVKIDRLVSHFPKTFFVFMISMFIGLNLFLNWVLNHRQTIRNYLMGWNQALFMKINNSQQ